jgi:hypothetical protein
MTLTFLVVGAENPRIRDLFNAVGQYAKVNYANVGPIVGRALDASDQFAHRLRSEIFAAGGQPDVIVFTWPQLCDLAAHFPDFVRVYYCKDPFDHWTCWDHQTISDLESRLLARCDAVFAVSRALADDFSGRTSARVIYLPNAVEEAFLNAAAAPRPVGLPGGQPILTSIGQINSTYDWPFIAALAAALPEARLCFVGNISEENLDLQGQILHQLRTTPNICFLDRQPHEALPAFMQHSDILFCPLKPGAYADRRSPLRLYDYLTTDRPILTTDIREARAHLPHLHIASTASDAAALAKEIFSGQLPLDLVARRAYIAQHTWPSRARQFLIELLQLPQLAPRIASMLAAEPRH